MTDERDPKLSQAYRELGREEPPRALDAAILAAAHRAERTHPAPLLSPGVGPAARRSWYFPVAAAAVIMLAAGVTLHLQMEQPGIDGIQASSERARPAPAAPAPAAEAPKPAMVEVPTLSRGEAGGTTAGPFAAPPPPAASAPSPALARKPMPMQRADEELRDRADGADGAASAERQAPSEAVAKRLQDAGETPEKWLERIAELRRAGKHDEADKALAEFRQRHPGYRISEAMLEKVERK